MPGLITEKEKLQLATDFLTSWKSRDWTNMKTLLSENVVWSLPGESILSGEVKGPDAITKRAGQLKDFGVMVEIKQILFNEKGLALSLHNTAKRGELILDEWVVIVCELEGSKISRLTTHLNDIAGINAFFISGIID